MARPRVRLIHWKAAEAAERAERLRAAGYRVDHGELTPATLREMGNDPPAAVVIDLGRIPSQGRDLALALRERKSTRGLPLVFVDGDREKVARIRKLLPDAVHTSWSRIRSALKSALARPPKDPVVPRSRMDGYSETPLLKKLGIKAGSVVALVGAPADFEKTLGKLPEGTTLRRHARGRSDLALFFPTSRGDMERRIGKLGRIAEALWVAWPKKASGVESDLSQTVVRRTGLAAGLVDYKVCSIDETWSGLKFTLRKR